MRNGLPSDDEFCIQDAAVECDCPERGDDVWTMILNRDRTKKSNRCPLRGLSAKDGQMCDAWLDALGWIHIVSMITLLLLHAQHVPCIDPA